MTKASTFWRAASPLVLASGSATRLGLLRAAGLPVEVIRPQLDERAVEAEFLALGGRSTGVAAALADAKALAVSPAQPERWVLAADQTLTCDGFAFHKPMDRAGAARQIAALAGRRHELTSAFALAHDGAVVRRGVRSAMLTMRSLSPDYIDAYLAEAGPAATASVGGYLLEGLGAQLFETVEGDHFTVLGLPLLDVLAALRELGLLA